MPPVRSHNSRQRKPPAGFEDIRDNLEVFNIKMKDAQNTPTANIPKHQAQWPVFQIHHQRSRYIYELYYEKEAISKELYEWLLKNGHADAKLIAKWKKQGYEKVRTLYMSFINIQKKMLTLIYSCAVFDACRPRRPTSTRRAYVACPKHR